jgi:type II secretory pathway pseudopilin PulG
MNRHDSGSALVEALVAAAIVMLMLGGTYTALSGARDRARIGADKSMALLVAQSALSTVGTTIPAESGRTTGIEGPFRWVVQVEPYDNTDLQVPMFSVTASVGRESEKTALVTLHTLRISDARQ